MGGYIHFCDILSVGFVKARNTRNAPVIVSSLESDRKFSVKSECKNIIHLVGRISKKLVSSCVYKLTGSDVLFQTKQSWGSSRLHVNANQLKRKVYRIGTLSLEIGDTGPSAKLYRVVDLIKYIRNRGFYLLYPLLPSNH